MNKKGFFVLNLKNTVYLTLKCFCDMIKLVF